MHRFLIICATLVSPLTGKAQSNADVLVKPPPEKQLASPPEQLQIETSKTEGEQHPKVSSLTLSETSTCRGAMINHSPRNQVITGQADLTFTVHNPDRIGTIVVYYSSMGNTQKIEGEVKAFRSDNEYLAQLPKQIVQPPGFAYWVVQRLPDDSELPVFAEQAHPHWVQVTDSSWLLTHERKELRLREGKRSRVYLSAEVVNFGKRRLTVPEQRLSEEDQPETERQSFEDNYYFLEAGYGYSFFSIIDELRFNIGRLSGQAAKFEKGSAPQKYEPAIYYGESMVTWFIYSGIRLRSSLLLGISHQGFEYGGGGELVLGHESRTHLNLGLRAVRNLGLTGRVRLGFLAMERLPMGTAIEITDYPVGSDFGVRLLYDIGYEFSAGVVLKLQVGFQGRTSLKGGSSLGGCLSYAL